MRAATKVARPSDLAARVGRDAQAAPTHQMFPPPLGDPFQAVEIPLGDLGVRAARSTKAARRLLAKGSPRGRAARPLATPLRFSLGRARGVRRSVASSVRRGAYCLVGFFFASKTSATLLKTKYIN